MSCKIIIKNNGLDELISATCVKKQSTTIINMLLLIRMEAIFCVGSKNKVFEGDNLGSYGLEGLDMTKI